MLSRRSKGLEGKPRVAVNFGGMLGGSRRYEPCACAGMRGRGLGGGIGYVESGHVERPFIGNWWNGLSSGHVPKVGHGPWKPPEESVGLIRDGVTHARPT